MDRAFVPGVGRVPMREHRTPPRVSEAKELHHQAAEALALAEADLQTVTREVEAHESLGAVLALRRAKAEEARGEALRHLQEAVDHLRSARAEADSLVAGAEAGVRAVAVEAEQHAHRRPSVNGGRAHEKQRHALAARRTEAEEAVPQAHHAADAIVQLASDEHRHALQDLGVTEAALGEVDTEIAAHEAGRALLEAKRAKSQEAFGQARQAFDVALQTLRSARGREA
ncbi:MAG: hypothetical protein RBU30_14845 [Polyangia bacterium]|jgi:hypothetical protein|nr:hypothetical protein [Polyangia bacterium]